MKSETATIQPRSRRRSAPSNEGIANFALHDPRTRVLIRVPFLKTGSNIIKAAPTAAHAAEATVPAAIAPIGDSRKPNEPSLPPAKTATPANESRSFLRVDAPHARTPTPHTTSPAWSGRADGWLARLPTQPLVWITAIISTTVVIVVLLRTGDRSNPGPKNPAPETNSAKREIKPHEHQAPADSAAGKNLRDQRVALHQQQPGSTKPKKLSRDGKTSSPPQVTADRTALAPENRPLTRRGVMNEPAALPPDGNWSSSAPVTNSTGAVNPDSTAPMPVFKVVDGPALGPPPVPANPAPQAVPTTTSDQPHAAAALTGKVEHVDHTTRR